MNQEHMATEVPYGAPYQRVTYAPSHREAYLRVRSDALQALLDDTRHRQMRRVLEVACGPGLSLSYLGRSDRVQLVGLDESPAMLRTASANRQRHRSTRRPRSRVGAGTALRRRHVRLRLRHPVHSPVSRQGGRRSRVPSRRPARCHRGHRVLRQAVSSAGVPAAAADAVPERVSLALPPALGGQAPRWPGRAVHSAPAGRGALPPAHGG